MSVAGIVAGVEQGKAAIQDAGRQAAAGREYLNVGVSPAEVFEAIGHAISLLSGMCDATQIGGLTSAEAQTEETRSFAMMAMSSYQEATGLTTHPAAHAMEQAAMDVYDIAGRQANCYMASMRTHADGALAALVRAKAHLEAFDAQRQNAIGAADDIEASCNASANAVDRYVADVSSAA